MRIKRVLNPFIQSGQSRVLRLKHGNGAAQLIIGAHQCRMTTALGMQSLSDRAMGRLIISCQPQ